MSDEKKLYQRLGLIMRGAREREKLSQDQVAEHLGIHRITYTHLENGKAGAPFHLVLKAAEFLGFTLDQLKDADRLDLVSSPELSASVAREIQKIRNELTAPDRGLT